MKKYKNILIVRTDKIGDVVLSLPLAGIIKNTFPDAKITFLVQNYTKPLVECCTNVDEVITLHKSGDKIHFSQNVKMLREKKYDLCITVSPKFKVAAILKSAGIKTRIGTGYRWYSFLFNKRIFEHRKTAERHELEYNINLLKPINITPEVSKDSVDYNIHPSKNSDLKVEQIIKAQNIDFNKTSIIIHPGSGGSAVDWPQSHFLELTRQMAQDLNINVFVTGSQNEKELCQKLVVSNNVYNLAGLFDLSELISLISKSDMMIANSTGPIHIAAALNKFVIGFYPKIVVCSEERWGPYTKNKIVFKPGICESNCSRKQCAELNCMTSIKPEDVYAKIKEVI